MTMQFEIKQYAMKSKLKSRALSILNYLIDRTNKKLTCFPSVSTIGKQLHISVSTVKRAMKELFSEGFLKREARFSEHKNGGQTSNLYTVSTPNEQQEYIKNMSNDSTTQYEEKEVVVEEATSNDEYVDSNNVEKHIEKKVEVERLPINSATNTSKKQIKHISFQTIFEEQTVLSSITTCAFLLSRKALRKEE